MSNHHPIDISVTTEYLPDQSKPESNRYAFAYHICIANRGDRDAQLLNRHWIIIDANQQRQEVRGVGVVGEQPLIASGSSFSYSSGVVLDTPVGTMHGHYQLVDELGNTFDAPIAPFLLATPNTVH
ncbi:MAG: Co2+/Mg2+ efflux protein ApaG [Porticoccaceae bacterium]|jgi:ApaG protein